MQITTCARSLHVKSHGLLLALTAFELHASTAYFHPSPELQTTADKRYHRNEEMKIIIYK